MGILHFRTGTWILLQNPFQWLVTAYRSPGSPPVSNIEWENRTRKRKKSTALTNRVWLTHQGGMSQRPFLIHFWLQRSPMEWYTSEGEKSLCTYESASWRKLGSIADDGNEYFLIRWARLFKPRSLRRIDPADAISRICWLGLSQFFRKLKHWIPGAWDHPLYWVSIEIRVRINDNRIWLGKQNQKRKTVIKHLTEAEFNGFWLRSASNECCHARSTMVTARLETVGQIWFPIPAPRFDTKYFRVRWNNDCWGWPSQWWRGRQLWWTWHWL